MGEHWRFLGDQLTGSPSWEPTSGTSPSRGSKPHCPAETDPADRSCWALLGSRLPSLRPGSCHWVENRISGLTLLSLFTFSGNSVHVSQVLNSLHVYIACVYYWGFSSVTMVENPSADTGDTGPIPGSRRCPGVLPGESHGQRSLVGYSAWGRKELDTTEHTCSLKFYFLHSFFLFFKNVLNVCVLVLSRSRESSQPRD